MEESSKEEKQQFLRERILGRKEIDANKFVDFLQEKKGEEGADISNWTMEDLKEVVKEFYKINNIPLENIEQKKEEIKKEEIKKEEIKKEEIKKEDNNNVEKNIQKKVELKTNVDNIENKKENIKIDNKKNEKKEESIKFIIDEDSLMDFMLSAKGINKKSIKIDENNSGNISGVEELKKSNIESFNNNQKFNFEQNFKNNNIYNNITINNNQQFNFDKNFKNDLESNNSIQFNFEKNFKTNNNNQKFDFEKNFHNNDSNIINNNNRQFKFEENFKNMNINNINQGIPKSEKNENDSQKINDKQNNINNSNEEKNNELYYNDKKEEKEYYNENNNDLNYNDNKEQIEEYNEKNINNNNDDFRRNISEEVEEKKDDKNNLDSNIQNPHLTNIIDKNDHDSEYGLIINDFIKAKIIETTEFSNHKDIIIKLSDPIKVEQAFFMGKSVNYLVTTSPFNFAVRRRYSDFNWLRETLTNIFNTTLIPKITKKGKVTTDKHDDNFIKKRMKFLEKFINYLIKDELIKSSQILYDFLTISKDEDFQNRKKFYEKIKLSPLADIRERKSLTGEIKIKITREKEIYLENIKDNSIYNSNLLKKLNNNFKLLRDELNTVIKRFETISDIYRQLYDISKNYLDQKTITESYAQMEIMFNKLSTSFESFKNFINSDIREYFKFIGNNFTVLNEMSQNVELSRINYIKTSKGLINKKNELFKKGDLSKWELSSSDKNNSSELLKDKTLACIKMLPKETKNCINQKEIYGFYLNKLIDEFEKMRQINSSMHKKKISNYCKEQIIMCSEYTRVLGDITMIMDSCTNKKK